MDIKKTIDDYLAGTKYPGPVGLALAIGVDPGDLPRLSKENPAIKTGLWRVVEVAEGMLYEKVYGSKAMIERTESMIGNDKVEDLTEWQFTDPGPAESHG